MTDVIFIVAGEGGHADQAHRFIAQASGRNAKLLLITDQSEQFNYSDTETELIKGFSALTKKNIIYRWMVPIYSLIVICRSLLLYKKYKPVGIVSFGPGFSVLVCLVGYFLRVKVVHIETWSRFYSASWTGQFMYKISQRFYIQNETLEVFYPDGIYAGRL